MKTNHRTCRGFSALVATTLVGAALTFGACDSATGPEVTTGDLVIEAFLFAGEPVADIVLKRTTELGLDPTLAPPVTDATVRLMRGGETWVLSHTGEGLYAYAGSDLEVRTGDVFGLQVDWSGVTATAETTVPEPPVGVGLSSDTVLVPNFGGGFGPGQGGFNLQDQQVEAVWDNPDAKLHFVVVESTVDNAELIVPDDFGFRRGGGARFRFISEPTTDSFFQIGLGLLEVLGAHDAIVYRVNQEYAELYENRTQDSRDLNEPPSNVRNGLGVFSAFSGRRVPFHVARVQ